MKIADLTGARFGRLTVEGYHGKNRHRQSLWNCRCDCGQALIVVRGSLSNGNTRSCGCLHIDSVVTHGKSRAATAGITREYRIWNGLRQRCENPKNPDYPNYGGRGIGVCDRWRESFENFLEDMGPSPSADHQIDRIDNNGSYSPENCRWASRIDQNCNKRTNRLFTLNGETFCLTEWARRIGIKPVTLSSRLSAGIPFEKAISLPVSRKARIRTPESDH